MFGVNGVSWSPGAILRQFCWLSQRLERRWRRAERRRRRWAKGGRGGCAVARPSRARQAAKKAGAGPGLGAERAGGQSTARPAVCVAPGCSPFRQSRERQPRPGANKIDWSPRWVINKSRTAQVPASLLGRKFAWKCWIGLQAVFALPCRCLWGLRNQWDSLPSKRSSTARETVVLNCKNAGTELGNVYVLIRLFMDSMYIAHSPPCTSPLGRNTSEQTSLGIAVSSVLIPVPVRYSWLGAHWVQSRERSYIL